MLAAPLANVRRAMPAEPRGGQVPFIRPVVEVHEGRLLDIDKLVGWYGLVPTGRRGRLIERAGRRRRIRRPFPLFGFKKCPGWRTLGSDALGELEVAVPGRTSPSRPSAARTVLGVVRLPRQFSAAPRPSSSGTSRRSTAGRWCRTRGPPSSWRRRSPSAVTWAGSSGQKPR